MNQAQLSSLQAKLSQRVIIPDEINSYRPKAKDILFTLDIQYTEKYAYIALDISRYPDEPITQLLGKCDIPAKYVSQFFCFREGPPLLTMIKTAREAGFEPDLILIDGHGLAHPRKFGVACYIGIYAQVPTIGCAKRPLLSVSEPLEHARGAMVPIKQASLTLGYSLRTQDGVNPVFVSPGHLISPLTSADIVLILASKYRLPEPIRRADQAARLHAKGVPPVSQSKDIGELIVPKLP
jgi:deoxyribonuclease V